MSRNAEELAALVRARGAVTPVRVGLILVFPSLALWLPHLLQG